MNIREYGLGDSTPYVKGVPRIVKQLGESDGMPACPNCGCPTTFEIEVSVEGHPLLRGGKGKGKYVGCAACPMATPMLMVAGE